MNKKINLENRQIPLHYQVADYILMMLHEGELDAADRLPTEEQLGDMFSVSRTTIRRALDHLLHKGLVFRKQGKGSFWTDAARTYRKEKLAGINREIFRITKRTVVRVLLKERFAAAQAISDELNLPRNNEVYVFKRLRYADSEPMSFTVNYIPVEYGEKIQKQHLEKMTMLETLETVVGIELGIIQHEVEITRANQEIADTLKITNLDPVLTVKTFVSDIRGRPVEVVWTHFVENKYRFRVVLDR